MNSTVLLAHDLEPGLLRTEAPTLARWLACGNSEPRVEALLEQRLLAAFGIAAEANALPVAALTAGFDGLDSSQQWLRADPVCLRPDLRDLALLPGTPPELTLATASALILEVNTALADGGPQLVVGRHPERWYAAVEAAPDLRAWPPRAAAGGGIQPWLPSGAARRPWLSWLTEVQMVLGTAEANQSRLRQGLPAVNSLWLWGAGTAAAPAAPRAGRIATQSTLAMALAARAGQGVIPLPLPAHGDASLPWLVVDDPGPGLAVEPAAAELRWAGPLLAALWRGQLRRITLDLPARRVWLARHHLLRFWRRW
jgi:hypothetical protein